MNLRGVITTAKFEFETKGILYTKTEKKIIDYIYQNISVIPFLSIGQLSEKLGVSDASLSRFVRHAGFRDFKELKTTIMEQSELETPAEKMTGTLEHSDQAGALDMLRYQQFCLAKTMELLSDAELEKAVEAIASARTIYLYGKGASAGLAALFHFRLNRLGRKTVLLPAGGSEMFEDLVHAGTGDLILIFGFQKIPNEARVVLKHRFKAGYRTLLISSRIFDGEDGRADINLFVYRGEAKEYHSMTAPTALVDSLVVLTARRLGTSALDHLAALYQIKEQYSEQIPR
jgi:DNA-binding MurR/RpiR family transcriptional regulator